jgi:hypothetical protein
MFGNSKDIDQPSQAVEHSNSMTTLTVPKKPSSTLARGYRVRPDGSWFNPSRDRRTKAQKKADRRERVKALKAKQD